MRILLVEDDAGMTDLLRQALTTQHYLVEIARDGQIGWELAEAFEYDLILLDLMLPKLSGIHFCQQLRQARYPAALNRNTPVLMMTSADAGTNRIAGLDAGADDYIAKPFNFDELLARVRALLRRGNTERSPLLVWEDLRLDPSLCQVRYKGQSIHLSAKEYKLLELFLRHPQRIFSHGTLIEHLWALEEIPTENAIRAQIKGVRKKLREAGVADCIETIYGLGYRLKELPAKSATSQGSQLNAEVEAGQAIESPLQPTPSPSTQTQLTTSINQFWQQYQPLYRERFRVIEQAVSALETATLSEALRQQAHREAHTLKGSLGSFGLEQASELSGKVEQLLQKADSLDQSQKEQLFELTLRLQEAMECPLPIGDAQFHPTELLFEAAISARSPSQTSSLNPSQPRGSRLLVVDADGDLATQIRQIASGLNFEVEVATHLSEAQLQIQQFSPDVVLLSLTFAGSTEPGFALLAQLVSQWQIPVLVVAEQDSLDDRVRVAQLGGKGFLQKSTAPAEVMKAVVNVLQFPNVTKAKVLIVDDDVQLLEVLHQLLQPWGFAVTLLNQPQQFWQTLEQVEPDLLLLDIEMPELNGIDLCQVVRNDLRWGDVPILMLSAHNDETTVQRVFTAGADDYVSKPIRPAELIARVLARLERAKVLKKLRSLGGVE